MKPGAQATAPKADPALIAVVRELARRAAQRDHEAFVALINATTQWPEEHIILNDRDICQNCASLSFNKSGQTILLRYEYGGPFYCSETCYKKTEQRRKYINLSIVK